MSYLRCPNCDRESCAQAQEDILNALSGWDYGPNATADIVDYFWKQVATCEPVDWRKRALEESDRADSLEDSLVVMEANYFSSKDYVKTLQRELEDLKKQFEIPTVKLGSVQVSVVDMDKGPTLAQEIQRLRTELDHYRNKWYELLTSKSEREKAFEPILEQIRYMIKEGPWPSGWNKLKKLMETFDGLR